MLQVYTAMIFNTPLRRRVTVHSKHCKGQVCLKVSLTFLGCFRTHRPVDTAIFLLFKVHGHGIFMHPRNAWTLTMVTAEQSKYLYKKVLCQYQQNIYFTSKLILTNKKALEFSFKSLDFPSGVGPLRFPIGCFACNINKLFLLVTVHAWK